MVYLVSYATTDKRIELFRNKNFVHLAIPTKHISFIHC